MLKIKSKVSIIDRRTNHGRMVGHIISIKRSDWNHGDCIELDNGFDIEFSEISLNTKFKILFQTLQDLNLSREKMQNLYDEVTALVIANQLTPLED